MEEIERIKEALKDLKERGLISLAYLYGSFAEGRPHHRSDIDLAIFINSKKEQEVIEIIERLSLLSERNIEILRLDDEDESPFIIQKALKGIPLVKPENDVLYRLYDYILHETESIRFRRSIHGED